ncbi:MAG: hybrid sensor histidine kinase/response regulator [Anaerolineales bacterium]|nr:hybrid sensor histidine kinase/response regulator [Anaerolineales bacterium]
MYAQSATPLQQKSILIVDDNPTNIAVIADYLEEQGFNVLVARDGLSGLEKAEYALPDLVLLDVMMPGIDGFDTCRRLKENEKTRRIPVIFMTALTETEHKIQGFRAGGVDYVTKPFQQEEVLARVMTHLQLNELTQHLEQLVHLRTAELQTAYSYLQQLDRAKLDFIQVTSHELRTPLSIIDGYTQLLQENEKVVTDDEAFHLVQNILKGTGRMQYVLNHILDALQIEQQLIRPYFQPVHFSEIINTLHHQFDTTLQMRHLRFTSQHLQELPTIWADEELMRKLFYHLLVNAIKYTPDGGLIQVTAREIPASNEPAQMEIVIQDNGIGIEPDQLELIFEKFYQGGAVAFHSTGQTTFKGGGPGLGLAIAKGIIAVHNGQIWAESDGYDEVTCPGSRFIVRLPLHPPQ